MKKLTTILAVLAVVTAAAGIARADWFPGDPYKMHFPQLPDLDGYDVNFEMPKVLADDWLCTQTGPVDDIHFWMSDKYDEQPQMKLMGVHVSIHKDDRTGAFSKPGELLWEWDFDETELIILPWPETGQQLYYDPNTGEVYPLPHFQIWQVNILDIAEKVEEVFRQEEGNIYWLDLSVYTFNPGADPTLGWKTADVDRYPDPYTGEHYEDDAVWGDFDASGNVQWNELIDPLTGKSLDLAFVITPEPGTMVLLGTGALGLILRRRRR